MIVESKVLILIPKFNSVNKVHLNKYILRIYEQIYKKKKQKTMFWLGSHLIPSPVRKGFKREKPCLSLFLSLRGSRETDLSFSPKWGWFALECIKASRSSRFYYGQMNFCFTVIKIQSRGSSKQFYWGRVLVQLFIIWMTFLNQLHYAVLLPNCSIRNENICYTMYL